MGNKKIDIIEIALKEDLMISLEPEERTYLDSLDDEFKQEIFDLVNNENYVDEIEKIVDIIIKKASFLPQEQQTYIKEKCSSRINKLKHSDLSTEDYSVNFLSKK